MFPAALIGESSLLPEHIASLTPHPAYDDLLNQGAQAADYDAALPFYQQAEQQLVQDAPVFFMRYGEGVRLIRPWVAGLTQTPSDHQNVGDVFYETIHILAH